MQLVKLLLIISISNVDGAASSIIRVTATPDSNDIVPLRNQLLEIDFVNTTILGEVDTVSTGDSGGGSSYNTTSSYTTPSSY
jgi:hypothetical protein